MEKWIEVKSTDIDLIKKIALIGRGNRTCFSKMISPRMLKQFLERENTYLYIYEGPNGWQSLGFKWSTRYDMWQIVLAGGTQKKNIQFTRRMMTMGSNRNAEKIKEFLSKQKVKKAFYIGSDRFNQPNLTNNLPRDIATELFRANTLAGLKTKIEKGILVVEYE